MQPMPTAKPAHSPLLLWLGYVFFVVYSSLVPLRFKDRTFDDAWAAFQNIPFLNLGVGSRADWISNGVLYVPVGFLTAYLLTQTFQRLPRFLLYVTALTFAVALAVGVEFTQLYFPQRTVSLNDIMAECIGSVLGILLAARYADWFKALVESFLNDSKRLKTLALDAYAFVYIALALFPYDFLISWAELSAKIDSGYWGWLVAGTSHSFVMTGIQLVAETTLVLPFGFLLARLIGPQRATYTQAALAGLLLGMGIELVQFFIASGISQGLSVLTRVVGVCGGLALSQHAAVWQTTHIANLAKRLTPAIALVYALTLLQINGFITLHWGGLAEAKARFDQINFTPFYYHYFTSEAKALFSLSVVALSYVPIAVLTWARGQSARVATAIALAVCTCIEIGKLFLTGTHADPSNLLIASAVSWFTVRLLQQLAPSLPMQPFVHDASPAKLDRVAAIEAIASPAPAVTTPLRSAPPWLWLCLISAGIWVVNFPAFPVLVAAALAACAAVVWRKPPWVFAIIPAALPIFDLATWSGRFYWDEFDAVLFVGLAVAYARVPAPKQARGPSDPLFRLLAWLVAASFAIAALRGMLPFQWPNANSFNTYYSPYNALRIVKGAVWAWLVFSLGKRFIQTGIDIRRPFAWGMTAGLTLTVAYIIWERLAFSELLNFYSSYRVTGPFSAIHVGGAYIECFLVVATPFLIGLMLEKHHWLTRLAATPILLATTYALMVTFSRNGFLSFAVGVLVVIMAAWVNSKQVLRSTFVYASILGAMLMVAMPIYKGSFTQSRMATVSADLGVRVAHWQDAMSIRDPDWLTAIFGMGLGRYPEANYWRSSTTARSGTYQFVNETGNTFLRLGSGDPIYVEQIVSLQAGQNLTLKLDVRPSVPNSAITVPVCQKLMLASANCVNLSFNLGPEFGTWRTLEKSFTTAPLSDNLWANQRPIKLALYYTTPRSTIDIDNISLQSSQGAHLLANGDFSAGLDHWFYSSDGHLQWHTKSLLYGVLFDQGWLGLIAMAMLFTLAISRATQKTWRGDIMSAATLAALISFLTVGLFDTLIDSPRFLLLLLLLCGIGASKAAYVHAAPPKHAATSARPSRLSRRGIAVAIALAIAGVAVVAYLQTRPQAPLPTLGKGQQTIALPPLPGQAAARTLLARSATEIISAINTAKAGQAILIQPGTYRINQNVKTAAAGTAQQRITVRASAPGQVQIEFNAQEGFLVQHPYWVFENLGIRGVCADHTYCEHAFHVVGQGAYLVVRNNLITDFNAHLKVNGLLGNWPDHGVLQHNTLTNTTERNTANPVTPLDLVGANSWQVLDNVVSNFVKADGNRVSYGLFMKGGGSNGRIERNLVICTPRNVSQPGVRVGISFGGGGTQPAAVCRGQRCVPEHSAGLAANNIVAHCNDSGIDTNQANRILLAHNTLINTAGIDVRNAPAAATLYGNLLQGTVRQRNGGQATKQFNETVGMAQVFADPYALDLAWRQPPDNIPSTPLVPTDFFGQPRGDGTPPGAIAHAPQ